MKRNSRYTITCLLVVLCLSPAFYSAAESTAHVAIIGGGIGGGYAAYYLWQLGLVSETDYNITVFEKDAVGGRAQEFEYEGEKYELGASMVYENNYYIRDILPRLGLQKRSKGDKPGTVVNLYDGGKIVFASSPSFLLNLLQMLLRYQLALFRFIFWPLRTFQRFEGIYKLQDAGAAFDTPEELLRNVSLFDYTQHTFAGQLKEALGESTAARRLSNELIGSCNRVNYNQHNSELHSLVGLISTLPAVDSRTFSIQNGNGQLAAKLMHHAHADITTHVSISKITKTPDGRWSLQGTFLEGSPRNLREVADAMEFGHDPHTGHPNGINTNDIEDQNTHDVVDFGPFDAVIVAAPLGGADLEFEGVDIPEVPKQEYQQTVTTYLRGLVNSEYFNASSAINGAVFATDDAEVPFTSIAPVKTYPDFFNLYKVFSSEPLSDAVLGRIFSNYSVVAMKVWDAYPKYKPPQVFAPFKLADGLYYNNAIESAASAMEMSAIAGRNSALLVHNYLDRTANLERPGLAQA